MKQILLKVCSISIIVLIISVISACNSSNSTTQPSIMPTPPANSISGTIAFSTVPKLNNPPTSSTGNAPQTIILAMTAIDSTGHAITPSSTNPININIYGAPNGVITPTSTTSPNGQVTIQYNGQWFPNNITINAWIKDTTNNGAAIGVTQLLQQNKPTTYIYGATSYQIPLTASLPGSLNVSADVGYSASTAGNKLVDFILDTGSLGVIVPASEFGSEAIGPGAQGSKYYDSSGNTYSGNYYLAPLSLKQKDGSIVQTQPILVLGISSASCQGPSTKICHTTPPTPNLHYIGVGFNRNSTGSDDLFNSPADNPFLHITDVNNGTDITPGYVLTPGEASGFQGLTLGISDVTGYNLVNLTPNTSVAGDFNAQYACYTIGLKGETGQTFCGTGLLDVGIDYMFLDLPKAQWPSGTYDASNNNQVPTTASGTPIPMVISMGNPMAMSYNYDVVNNPANGNPAPESVQWIDSTSSGMIFVNTGRRALYQYDYMYNGQYGQVGFKNIPH